MTIFDYSQSPARQQTTSTSTSLRIVHLAANISPSAGGPPTVACRLAASQAALGHQVTILSNINSNDARVHEEATRHIPDFSDVRTMLFPWTNYWKRRFGLRFLSTYRKLFAETDIIHFHGVWEPMFVTAAHVARRLNVPYIVRACGMLDPWTLSQKRLKKKIALMMAHKNMLNHAAFIHTLSDDESRLIEPLRLTSPSAVIPNGINFSEVDQDCGGNAALAAAVPALKDHPYILFLGRLHFKKGLDILADAFARIAAEFPTHHLVVVGSDGGAQRDFELKIREHGLQDRVHLTGQFVGPCKFAAYRNADCFCLPSRQEGFANSIVEALSASLPVAISTECHFERVETIGAGKVFSLTAQAAAQSLREILSKPAQERRQMGQAGRDFVEQHLTWSSIAAKTINAYQGVLGQQSSAARAQSPTPALA